MSKILRLTDQKTLPKLYYLIKTLQNHFHKHPENVFSVLQDRFPDHVKAYRGNLASNEATMDLFQRFLADEANKKELSLENKEATKVFLSNQDYRPLLPSLEFFYKMYFYGLESKRKWLWVLFGEFFLAQLKESRQPLPQEPALIKLTIERIEFFDSMNGTTSDDLERTILCGYIVSRLQFEYSSLKK